MAKQAGGRVPRPAKDSTKALFAAIAKEVRRKKKSTTEPKVDLKLIQQYVADIKALATGRKRDVVLTKIETQQVRENTLQFTKWQRALRTQLTPKATKPTQEE